MAWTATGSKTKRSFFTVAPPNYQDFNGPSDGDYARYVQGLMAWADQVQERVRLQALGAKARAVAVPDAQWGREGSAASRSAQRAAAEVVSAAQSGGVESHMDRLQRKAKAQVHQWRLDHPSASPDAKHAQGAKKASALLLSMRNPWLWVFMVVLVLIGIFASSLLPVVIIGGLVFNVIRAVRAASSAPRS